MGEMANEDDIEQDAGEGQTYRPSKSLLKREAESLQELGVRLAALSDKEIGDLELPEKLIIALRDLRRLPTHGAQLRQRQYIGKLMRSIDPAPVLAKIDERKRQHDLEIRHFQKIERWRDRLLAEPEALTEWLQEHPDTDRDEIKRLIKKAEKERSEQRPHAGSRELFAFLRQLLS
jgi:ribosome-associated protein